MNKDLLQQILGKWEKSFYNEAFNVSGSAGYAKSENELIENYSEHTLRYLNSSYTRINRFLNCKPGVNYLDPNENDWDKEAFGYDKGDSNFPLENIVSDILNITKDMKPLGTPQTLYRGTFDHYYPMLDSDIVGETISLNGITSTSISQCVADIFANNYENSSNQNSLIFKINAPSNMPGIRVKTDLFDEDEIILHPAKYRIDKIETKKLKNCQIRIVTMTPTELLDVKQLILEGLDQANKNHNEPVNKWVIERNKSYMQSVGVNPDTAIEDLKNRVVITPSPSPKITLDNIMEI